MSQEDPRQQLLPTNKRAISAVCSSGRSMPLPKEKLRCIRNRMDGTSCTNCPFVQRGKADNLFPDDAVPNRDHNQLYSQRDAHHLDRDMCLPSPVANELGAATPLKSSLSMTEEESNNADYSSNWHDPGRDNHSLQTTVTTIRTTPAASMGNVTEAKLPS
jgi:hypothetical protein